MVRPKVKLSSLLISPNLHLSSHLAFDKQTEKNAVCVPEQEGQD